MPPARAPAGSHSMHAVLNALPAAIGEHTRLRVDEHRHVIADVLDDHQGLVDLEHPENGDALAPAGCCRHVPSRPAGQISNLHTDAPT